MSVTLAVAAVVAADGGLDQAHGVVSGSRQRVAAEADQKRFNTIVLAGILTRVLTGVLSQVLLDRHPHEGADFVVVHSTHSS
jgi:hypothetical protein